ncbi:hypothetical protein WA158_001446 [Blastocystis sp. Blastoise]
MPYVNFKTMLDQFPKEELSTCGRRFMLYEMTYKCQECSLSQNCMLCQDCYDPSKHINHHVIMVSQKTPGKSCSCGNPSLIKQEHGCPTHKQKQTRIYNTYTDFPKNYVVGFLSFCRQTVAFIYHTIELLDYVIDRNLLKKKEIVYFYLRKDLIHSDIEYKQLLLSIYDPQETDIYAAYRTFSNDDYILLLNGKLGIINNQIDALLSMGEFFFELDNQERYEYRHCLPLLIAEIIDIVKHHAFLKDAFLTELLKPIYKPHTSMSTFQLILRKCHLLFPNTIDLFDNLFQCLIQNISQENINYITNQYIREYSSIQYSRTMSPVNKLSQGFYLLSDQLFLYPYHSIQMKHQIFQSVFTDFNNNILTVIFPLLFPYLRSQPPTVPAFLDTKWSSIYYDLELLLDSNLYDDIIYSDKEYTLQFITCLSMLEGGDSLHPDNINNLDIQSSFPREIMDSINRITFKWVHKAFNLLPITSLLYIVKESSKLLKNILESRSFYHIERYNIIYKDIQYDFFFTLPYYSLYIPLTSFISTLVMKSIVYKKDPQFMSIIDLFKENKELYYPLYEFALQYKSVEILILSDNWLYNEANNLLKVYKYRQPSLTNTFYLSISFFLSLSTYILGPDSLFLSLSAKLNLFQQLHINSNSTLLYIRYNLFQSRDEPSNQRLVAYFIRSLLEIISTTISIKKTKKQHVEDYSIYRCYPQNNTHAFISSLYTDINEYCQFSASDIDSLMQSIITINSSNNQISFSSSLYQHISMISPFLARIAQGDFIEYLKNNNKNPNTFTFISSVNDGFFEATRDLTVLNGLERSQTALQSLSRSISIDIQNNDITKENNRIEDDFIYALVSTILTSNSITSLLIDMMNIQINSNAQTLLFSPSLYTQTLPFLLIYITELSIYPFSAEDILKLPENSELCTRCFINLKRKWSSFKDLYIRSKEKKQITKSNVQFDNLSKMMETKIDSLWGDALEELSESDETSPETQLNVQNTNESLSIPQSIHYIFEDTTCSYCHKPLDLHTIPSFPLFYLLSTLGYKEQELIPTNPGCAPKTKTIYPFYIYTCNHPIHFKCFKHLQEQKKSTCPLCRQFISLVIPYLPPAFSIHNKSLDIYTFDLNMILKYPSSLKGNEFKNYLFQDEIITYLHINAELITTTLQFFYSYGLSTLYSLYISFPYTILTIAYTDKYNQNLDTYKNLLFFFLFSISQSLIKNSMFSAFNLTFLYDSITSYIKNPFSLSSDNQDSMTLFYLFLLSKDINKVRYAFTSFIYYRLLRCMLYPQDYCIGNYLYSSDSQDIYQPSIQELSLFDQLEKKIYGKSSENNIAYKVVYNALCGLLRICNIYLDLLINSSNIYTKEWDSSNIFQMFDRISLQSNSFSYFIEQYETFVLTQQNIKSTIYSILSEYPKQPFSFIQLNPNSLYNDHNTNLLYIPNCSKSLSSVLSYSSSSRSRIYSDYNSKYPPLSISQLPASSSSRRTSTSISIYDSEEDKKSFSICDNYNIKKCSYINRMTGELDINSYVNPNHYITSLFLHIETSRMNLYYNIYKYMGFVGLFKLPSLFVELVQYFSQCVCVECHHYPEVPVICLICGRVLCYKSKCCVSNNETEDVCHAKYIHKGHTIYLHPQYLTVLLYSPDKKVYELPFPYIYNKNTITSTNTLQLNTSLWINIIKRIYTFAMSST